jgi:hypothetical protein
MRVHVRLTGMLYCEIVRDLLRPHPFAAERVGFALGRVGSLANGRYLILLGSYHPVPDEQYVDDPTVGARIGSEPLGWAMEAAYRGRSVREGVFHVHLHDYDGPTGMSRTDKAELPKLVPGFRSVNQGAPHGIVILSRDHGSGWIWLPGSEKPCNADSIQVIGTPLRIFDRRVAE